MVIRLLIVAFPLKIYTLVCHSDDGLQMPN
jgi:hypothetical protein